MAYWRYGISKIAALNHCFGNRNRLFPCSTNQLYIFRENKSFKFNNRYFKFLSLFSLADGKIVPNAPLSLIAHEGLALASAGDGVNNADQLSHEKNGNRQTTYQRQGFDEGFLLFLQVQQHHDKHDENHDGPRVNEYLDGPEELRVKLEHDSRRRGKAQGQANSRTNRICLEHDKQAGDQCKRGQNVKNQFTGKKIHK